ncbi:MAG: hypothetical protein Q9162_004684 [Coniocarpon cinnabarinum]
MRQDDRSKVKTNGVRMPDFDPEDDLPEYEESSGSEPENEGVNGFTGREHYENINKSKLRGRDPVTLGTQYAGSKVRRKGIEEEEDQHDPFAAYGSDEESDELNAREHDESDNLDKDGVAASEDSGSPPSGDEDMEDMRSDSDEEHNLRSTANEARDRADTARLKALLVNESSTISTSLAASQRADAQKGQAVQKQQRTFDALLTSRIRMQNALVAMNTLPTVRERTPTTEIQAAAQSAEDAARRLWSQLDTLRCSLLDAKTGTKRKRPTAAASVGEIWTHMQDLERASLPQRRATLAKWSEKTSSTASKLTKSSFGNSLSRQAEMTLLDVLDGHLADPDRLVKKTRIPRSAAPVQAKTYVAERRARRHDDTDEAPADEGVRDIYDDADFYSSLLKDLISRRQSQSTASSTTPQTLPQRPSTTAQDLEAEYRNASQKSAATKKAVDTRASKGRKMRYTVHEKLVNFMVPDDRGNWGERQRGELFASLFGARNEGGKEVNGGIGEGENEAEGALRLFRS